MVVATFAVAIGLSFLLGYLTPFASALTAIVSLSVVVVRLLASNFDLGAVRLSSVFTAVIAIALACLGPGAFSLDARQYGRHEIIIPRRPDSSLEE